MAQYYAVADGEGLPILPVYEANTLREIYTRGKVYQDVCDAAFKLMDAPEYAELRKTELPEVMTVVRVETSIMRNVKQRY